MAKSLLAHSLFLLIIFDVISLYGSTGGHLWIPSTSTLKAGQWDFHLQGQQTFEKTDPKLSRDASEHAFGVSAGVGENGPLKAQMTVDWREPTTGDAIEALQGEFRMSAFETKKDGYSVALGIDRFGLRTNVSDWNMIYGLGDFRLDEYWTGAFGFYSGNGTLLINPDGKADQTGVLAEVRRKFSNLKGDVGVEFQSGQNRFGYLFLSSMLNLREDIFGWFGYGISTTRRNHMDIFIIRLQIDY